MNRKPLRNICRRLVRNRSRRQSSARWRKDNNMNVLKNHYAFVGNIQDPSTSNKFIGPARIRVVDDEVRTKTWANTIFTQPILIL